MWCVPLVMFVGYLITDTLTTSTFSLIGLLALTLPFRLLLRWHHFLLIAMVALSDTRLINVPRLSWPMIYLAIVVVVPANEPAVSGGWLNE